MILIRFENKEKTGKQYNSSLLLIVLFLTDFCTKCKNYSFKYISL